MAKSEWRKYLTAEELAEYDKLVATPEHKAAVAEYRAKYKAKQNLYRARALFHRGETILGGKKENEGL